MKLRPLAQLAGALLAGALMGWVVARRSGSVIVSDSVAPADANNVSLQEAPLVAADVPALSVRGANQAAEDSRRAMASAFAEIAHQENDEQRRALMDRLFGKWAILDAHGAASFVLSVENEDMRKEAMLRVMQTWATQDPVAALDWADRAGFVTAYEREVAMSMACSQVARSDPTKALRLAFAYKLDERADGLCEGLAARWAEADLPSASAWVCALPLGPQRDSLVGGVALVLFEQSPEKAAQLVMEKIPAGRGQEQALLSLVNRLAARDPESAQEWVATFPQGELRNRALQNLDGFLNRQISDTP